MAGKLGAATDSIHYHQLRACGIAGTDRGKDGHGEGEKWKGHGKMIRKNGSKWKMRLAQGALAVMLALTAAGCQEAKGDGSLDENKQSVVEGSQVENQGGSEAENGSEAQTVEREVTPTPEPTPEPTPSPEEIYAEMVGLSLKYEGNYYRLKKVIEKLRAGEEISLAILGGSVTEGAGAGSNDKGYAYQFADALAQTYAVNGRDQIRYVNAGLSGTPSVLGLMRYQQDVVKPLGEDPDLLIIEFAVNDWQEATGGRAYESMVYEALSAKEDAAVICLCSVAKTGWNTQDVYLPIVKSYQIPLVSLKDAVFISNSKTRIKATDYFMDDYHPKFYGHQLMKDCLMNLFAMADAAPACDPAEIPAQAVKGRDFTTMVQVDSVNKVKGMKTGGFGDTDEKVVTEFFTKSASFPNNFYHKAGSKNDPLTMKVKCKKILVNFKTANDATLGKADFYVDGKLVATADGNSAGGWNNCNVLMILDEQEAAIHTFEVKMADDSLEKGFTVLSISYCE